MNIQRLIPHIIALALATFTSSRAAAEDWGSYAIVPVSAQALVLEAVDSGRADGTVVSINKPAGGANQKWTITPREESLFTIAPARDPTLVLTATKGGTKHGTAIVLEKDSGQPWQLWALTKHENGSYSLTPRHAPELGLDHFGGKPNLGAKIDLWAYNANDQHLQWFIKPLAGTGAAAPAVSDVEAYEPPEIEPEKILPGATKQFTFTQSEIFPGTVRDVTVFIPAQSVQKWNGS